MLISGDKNSVLMKIKLNDHVLDIGAGKALRWIPILKKYPDLKLTIYEPDSKELNIAKSNVIGRNITYVSNICLIENNSADLIFSFAVLEHVWNKSYFFENISRVLKKSGSAYISYDDGHFRNYLFKKYGKTFQFKNILKTKLHLVWRLLKIYRKYQKPVNSMDIAKLIERSNLKIVDEYYSAINFLKDFELKLGVPLTKETLGTLYDLEKKLNIEYESYYDEEFRFKNHGKIWEIMSTRTIHLKHSD